MKIVEGLLPFIKVNRAEKSIQEDINKAFEKINQNENTPLMNKFRGVSVEDANSIFENLSDNRKSLEDKAKVTAVAVTVSFTLFGGMAGYLLNLREKFLDHNFFNISLILALLILVFYLIVSGWYSLKTLNSRPTNDFSLDDLEYLVTLSGNEDNMLKEKVYLIARNYELKMYDNLKLSNYVIASNTSLRNSLVCVGLLLLITTSSFIIPTTSNNDKVLNEISNVHAKTNTAINEVKSVLAELNELSKNVQQQRKFEPVQLQYLNDMTEKMTELSKKIDVLKFEMEHQKEPSLDHGGVTTR
ncbi:MULTISPECIES: hypothetical protein [unclassified Paenibacillus]|uniref:hypothetical protein n=1 Tax=unclassified Paenibacillus TaxID=185978 RepID=UPI001AEAB68C|nr:MULTISPECIES: hypothetical protein [unclassified Paenibacillus]MBP1154646.1 hypothetical protein [Paenibacillus sp. PvP091]MBP1169970.1 hypothetical protein [Paenibacillus sp. PvR098]MBP2440998.1 hypothetical protein [Paenibacillus sp. PvP052]